STRSIESVSPGRRLSSASASGGSPASAGAASKSVTAGIKSRIEGRDIARKIGGGNSDSSAFGSARQLETGKFGADEENSGFSRFLNTRGLESTPLLDTLCARGDFA